MIQVAPRWHQFINHYYLYYVFNYFYKKTKLWSSVYLKEKNWIE